MNFWLLGVLILQFGLLLCGFVCMKGKLAEAIVAMAMAVGIVSVALLAAEGAGRPAWFDLALALALLSFPSGLVSLVFLRREL